MQTFLPYPDFKESFRALDSKRLGKQRVEAFQILNAIMGRPRKDGSPKHVDASRGLVSGTSEPDGGLAGR